MQSSLFELNLIGGREDYFTNNWANTYTLHKWLPLCACVACICNNWRDRIADGSATEYGSSLVTCYRAPAAGSPEKLSVPVVTDPASWSCGAAAGSAAASAGSGSSCDTSLIWWGPHSGALHVELCSEWHYHSLSLSLDHDTRYHTTWLNVPNKLVPLWLIMTYAGVLPGGTVLLWPSLHCLQPVAV